MHAPHQSTRRIGCRGPHQATNRIGRIGRVMRDGHDRQTLWLALPIRDAEGHLNTWRGAAVNINQVHHLHYVTALARRSLYATLELYLNTSYW